MYLIFIFCTNVVTKLICILHLTQAIWPYSGHYRPTEKNFMEFISFLEEHKVDMTNVKVKHSLKASQIGLQYKITKHQFAENFLNHFVCCRKIQRMKMSHLLNLPMMRSCPLKAMWMVVTLPMPIIMVKAMWKVQYLRTSQCQANGLLE